MGIGTCKVVAKIASELCKPNGLLEVAPGEEQDFLNPLPVAKLPGVGKKREQALKGIGINTIGELASVPLDRVTEQFRVTGIVIHSYAKGIDDRKVEAPDEPKSISKQITLAKNSLDRHFLKANLHWVQEVGKELRCRNKKGKIYNYKAEVCQFQDNHLVRLPWKS